MIWAAVTLLLCLALIALRPFETFFISDRFVGQLESLKQLIAIAFVILLLPVSVWWLFLFRTKGVKLQFQAADADNQEQQSAITSEV
jgi:high-affinity Fe2+/Pb2+ permease